jgi:alpha-tubulin suppressor-like RCC1 family protein
MGLTSVAEIAVSPAAHACAELTDGSVECWGENDSGQLGDGTTTRRALPTPVLF